MRSAGKLFTLVTFLTLTVGIAAQQSGGVRFVPPSPAPLRFTETWRPDGSTSTMVVGSVVDSNQVPVGNLRVQLRNILSGKVLFESVGDSLGRFAFSDLEPGSYVVEVVLANQRVLAVSSAATVAHYQVFDTIVQLPGRWDYRTNSVVDSVRPWQFFGLASNNSMTASTLSMAAGYQVSPVDAGEPVSPH